MLPNSDAIMDMLKNKDTVLKVMIKDMEVSQKNAASFKKLEELFKENKEVSTEAVLKAAATSLRHLNEVNTRLLTILMIYISGGNYDTDVGRMLIKMGRGEEALREMMNVKFSGSKD